MDERESSAASSVDFYDNDNEPSTPPRAAQIDVVATKRKAEDLAPCLEKKRKLDSPSPTSALKPCAGLPPAAWQHIFRFCSLFDFGRLLQVNRSFRSYLLDVHNVSLSDPPSGSLRLLKSESVWASARNALPTKPPKPLPGFSELQMWQLAWSKRCQFCGKKSSFSPGEKVWQKGPDVDGVRVIWPFGVRSCGPCLKERCQTDTSLLFSNASALRPALPYAFITNDHNYVPACTLRETANIPASVEIAKFYYKEHVENITSELNEVLSRGGAAAEEWSKGLEARGKERIKLAENWEQWEAKHQSWSDQQQAMKHALSPATSPAPTSRLDPSRSPMRHAPSPVIHAPVPATTAPQFMQPRPPTVPQQYTPLPVPGSVQPSRSERNLHDANEAKAGRKADIERRCQEMDPPIAPNVLRHMDSFKAAIIIPQPMTDPAWSVLQPRLLAQLPAAQRAEADHVSRMSSISRAADRRHPDINSKEAKEVMDREWEESQRPIRDKLSAIAEGFIDRDWNHGRAVTYENSPKFAVDLLMYVRRMFHVDNDKEEGSSGHEQPDSTAEESASTSRPKLALENMKWVYDNKIKPLTEQLRKELFLCNGCEGNSRYYGFEGVIQHFGAKHTHAFSVGNVVVHWREAEWPEETPFHPDPISVKHAYHAPSSAAGHSNYGGYYGGYSRAGTSAAHVQSHLSKASPVPYQYSGHYNNGPFAPPQMPSTIPGYDYSQPYGAPMDTYPYQSTAAPGYGFQTGNRYLTSPAISDLAIVPPPTVPAQVPGANDVLHKNNEAENRTGLFDKQVSTVIEMAQDIWKQTSGIKDLPNSLRIYVLLQRVISKFHIEFNHEPNLNHFIDAFSNHEISRSLKNAPDLSCKACQHEYSHMASRQEERRAYTVLNLFSHFRSQHFGPPVSGYGNGQLPSSLDWKEDMIELPSDRFISGLIHAPGMDDGKLRMIATVFPKLFPTPLPRIGTVDNNGSATPSRTVIEESKTVPKPDGTPEVSTEKSGPSTLNSPYGDSPKVPRPAEDEYDPQRPALSINARQPTRSSNKKHSYRDSPPSDRRPRYYAEPRYYVGSPQRPSERVLGANGLSVQLPRDPMDEDYSHPREYLEYGPNPRTTRDTDPVFEEYRERRPVFHDQEAFYHPSHEEFLFQPDSGIHVQDYRHMSRQARFLEEDGRRPEYRYVREPRSPEPSRSGGKSAADRFLEEFVPGMSSTDEPSEQASASMSEPKRPVVEQDVDDGSRYSPPPPSAPTDDATEQRRSPGALYNKAPSTVSNGSRYEEHRSSGRNIPTPDSARASRRPGPHRRRDRYHDHVHSRYYRYMSVARDEPYSRAASMSRSQSKRYERYAEQRRRIDQQETPQPNADQDPAYSRDQSVDQVSPEDTHRVRQPPRDYVSVQDRLHPYSPQRYRYAGYPEESRGPQPVYVDEYGYEIIRVPRESRPQRGPFFAHAPSRYVDHESEHIQYVPVSYDRPVPQRYDGRHDYVYYEEQERERERPLPTRRSAYEPEGTYEPPPEIKIESAASVPDAP